MQLTTVLPQARHRALVLDEARPLPAGGQGGVAARARGGRGWSIGGPQRDLLLGPYWGLIGTYWGMLGGCWGLVGDCLKAF